MASNVEIEIIPVTGQVCGERWFLSSTTSKTHMDGIYIAYFSGWLGNSFGVFHIAHGIIRGFDAGGLLYRGLASVDAQGQCIGGMLQPDFQALPDKSSVSPQLLDTELLLPPDFRNGQVHFVTTPVGDISVSFERLVRI